MLTLVTMRLSSGDSVLATSLLDDQLYCIYAQHLRPSMAALQDTPVCTLLLPCGCTVLDDNALIYLSAVVLRVHDAADI